MIKHTYTNDHSLRLRASRRAEQARIRRLANRWLDTIGRLYADDITIRQCDRVPAAKG